MISQGTEAKHVKGRRNGKGRKRDMNVGRWKKCF
jgi:hypothetical protein